MAALKRRVPLFIERIDPLASVKGAGAFIADDYRGCHWRKPTHFTSHLRSALHAAAGGE
jgi:hypothetical protein